MKKYFAKRNFTTGSAYIAFNLRDSGNTNEWLIANSLIRNKFTKPVFTFL